jgi:hypothetical protein
MIRLVSCGVRECRQASKTRKERKNIEQNTYSRKTRYTGWPTRDVHKNMPANTEA